VIYKSLIIGGDGFIGKNLRHALETENRIVYATTRKTNTNDIYFDLSISDIKNVKFPVVDTVFICAGLTGFKKCQDNIGLAQKVNSEAPAKLAEHFSQQGAHVIYLSTSAVFDCNHSKIRSDFCKSPKSVYGKTKSEGEDLILKVGEKTTVLRLTKVVHENLSIFRKWNNYLKKQKNIQAFVDLYFCPITIEEVINSLTIIAEKQFSGVYQVSGESDISYYDAAIELAHTIKANPMLVRPCKAIENGVAENNILRHTSLDTSSLPCEFNFKAPNPINVLRKIYKKLI